MTKISILGCGWLGFPLAKALLEKGFSVNGSTTSTEKLLSLKNAGISPFLIELGEVANKGNVSEFLEGALMLLELLWHWD